MQIFRQVYEIANRRLGKSLIVLASLGLGLLLSLAACQMIPPGWLQPTAISEGEGSVSTKPAFEITATPGDTIDVSATTTVVEQNTLRIWLPPQFDPAADTTAGALLFARLLEFTNENPTVRVEVRLKALEGTGGLLESLSAANAAAPLALPDLIALPRSLLESAALKGLVYPYDGMTTILQDDDWYDYARQLAYLQESIFGLPFAGDAQLLVYHSRVVDLPPRDWQTAVEVESALAFSAADPQALFTIHQYLAAGGAIMDEQGRPYLDESLLVEVLKFYQQCNQSGLMPLWLTQLESDDQVWGAFAEQQAPMVITWASRYFNTALDLPFETQIAPQITADGQVSTLAKGWVWALASPDAEHRELAAKLAEFLVASEFLAEWTPAAGYLPPTKEALRGWQDDGQRTLIGRLSQVARLTPSEDLLSSLGPALEEVVVLVLKQQADPQTAAKIAAERVNMP